MKIVIGYRGYNKLSMGPFLYRIVIAIMLDSVNDTIDNRIECLFVSIGVRVNISSTSVLRNFDSAKTSRKDMADR